MKKLKEDESKNNFQFETILLLFFYKKIQLKE